MSSGTCNSRIKDIASTPFPDQVPKPKVDVLNAVERFIGALLIHSGLIVPVIVEGTNSSIEIVVV